MKNFKKILALVVATVMILGTMSMAFAEAIQPEGLTKDTTVTISGLDTGDQVTLYKLVEWANNDDNTSAGWKLTSAFANDDACKEVLRKINAVTTGVYSLTEDDVNAFTTVINANGFSGPEITGAAVEDGSSVNTVDPGMYIALVKPAVAGTLYNPIIVSADYLQPDPETNVIDASSAHVGANTGLAKKETLKVEKEEDDATDTTDNSFDVGDTVDFTVKTTIPTFADVYVNPSFVVTDEMSEGLVLKTGTIHVYESDGTTEIADLTAAATESGTKGWVLTVPSTYFTGASKLAAPKPIVIKYQATLTESAFTSVTEEVNDVKVEFSNNPNNKDDKGTVM